MSDAEVNRAEGRHTRLLPRLVALRRGYPVFVHRVRLSVIVIVATSHLVAHLTMSEWLEQHRQESQS